MGLGRCRSISPPAIPATAAATVSGRFSRASEIADLVVFLAGERAANIVGSDVRIDGARVRAGSNVIVSPLVTHREEGLYERPAEFLPERWLSGRPSELPRGAYIPFGAGAHACVGQSLALAIIWLTLAITCRRWRLRADRDAAALVPRAPELRFTLELRG